MKSQRWTDEQIVWAIQAGGEPCKLAEEYLFKTLWHPLFSGLRRLGATQDEAQESVIHGVYQLIRQIAQDNSIEHFDRYAYIVARNYYFQLCKRRRQDLALEHAEKASNKSEEEIKKRLELADALKELEKMGNPCQTILTMKGDGYSDEEILVAVENLPGNNIHTIGSLRNRVLDCRLELQRRLGDINNI